ASAKTNPGGEDRPAYAETDYPHRAFGWSALRALRSGKYLYIQAPERELYNQSADPAAARNLAGDTKAVADTMAAQLDDFRQKTSQTLIDRKSTRLNSSHVAISYAVFCLKKKKYAPSDSIDLLVDFASRKVSWHKRDI